MRTISMISSDYRSSNPGCEAIALALTSQSEYALQHHIFGNVDLRAKRSRREVIDRIFSEEKPAGFEMVVWNQRETAAVYPRKLC